MITGQLKPMMRQQEQMTPTARQPNRQGRPLVLENADDLKMNLTNSSVHPWITSSQPPTTYLTSFNTMQHTPGYPTNMSRISELQRQVLWDRTSLTQSFATTPGPDHWRTNTPLFLDPIVQWSNQFMVHAPHRPRDDAGRRTGKIPQRNCQRWLQKSVQI